MPHRANQPGISRRTGAPRRRPRVAGRSRRPEPGAAAAATPTENTQTTPTGTTVEDSPVENREQRPGPGRRRTRLVALAAALGIACGLAGWFAVQTYQLRSAPAAENTALVDVADTAQVISHVSAALEKVYSYDFTRLDENERAAREVISPEFADDFDTLFAQVRKLAPEQKAVVSATVATAAVRELGADRAVVVVFLDQQATRGADARQLVAAGRLTVTAQRVDGRWQIAGVDSR